MIYPQIHPACVGWGGKGGGLPYQSVGITQFSILFHSKGDKKRFINFIKLFKKII